MFTGCLPQLVILSFHSILSVLFQREVPFYLNSPHPSPNKSALQPSLFSPVLVQLALNQIQLYVSVSSQKLPEVETQCLSTTSCQTTQTVSSLRSSSHIPKSASNIRTAGKAVVAKPHPRSTTPSPTKPTARRQHTVALSWKFNVPDEKKTKVYC